MFFSSRIETSVLVFRLLHFLCFGYLVKIKKWNKCWNTIVSHILQYFWDPTFSFIFSRLLCCPRYRLFLRQNQEFLILWSLVHVFCYTGFVRPSGALIISMVSTELQVGVSIDAVTTGRVGIDLKLLVHHRLHHLFVDYGLKFAVSQVSRVVFCCRSLSFPSFSNSAEV